MLACSSLATTACGAKDSNESESLEDSGVVLDGGVCPLGEPPDIVMRAAGDDHRAAQTVGCLFHREAGCGKCRMSTGSGPRSFVVVDPSAEISFSMALGSLVSPAGCKPECPPTLRVHRHGFADDYAVKPVAEVIVDEDVPLALDLSAGRYELRLDTRFEAGSLSGDLIAAFGLIVGDGAGAIDAGSE
jgi:hypothetical protein